MTNHLSLINVPLNTTSELFPLESTLLEKCTRVHRAWEPFDAETFEGVEIAIENDDIVKATKLIARLKLEDINWRWHQYSLLELASIKGRIKIVKLLVEAGAKNTYMNIHRYKPCGYSALYYAGLYNHIDVLEYLLKQGADPEVECENQGKTFSLLPDLIRRNKDISLRSVELLVGYAKNKSQFVNSRGERRELALSSAFKHDRADLFKFLFEQGGDRLNFVYQTQSSRLFEAAKRGLYNMLKYEIDNGGDLNIQDEETGCSLLHISASYNHTKIVRYLLENGINTKLCTSRKIFVSMKDQTFVTQGADWETYAKRFRHLAALSAIKRWLSGESYFTERPWEPFFEDDDDCLNAIVDINERLENKNTLLHFAMQQIQYEHLHPMIKKLIDLGSSDFAFNESLLHPFEVGEATLKSDEVQKGDRNLAGQAESFFCQLQNGWRSFGWKKSVRVKLNDLRIHFIERLE